MSEMSKIMFRILSDRYSECQRAILHCDVTDRR